ncbi:hypothetical protein, partial [Enterococcus faecium]|uniref:hypothetical protein n=1 Tax=Enterococcus faecium TaxID=1352 RepID=UPI00292F4345
RKLQEFSLIKGSFNEHLKIVTNESDCLRQSSDKVIDHPKIAVKQIKFLSFPHLLLAIIAFPTKNFSITVLPTLLLHKDDKNIIP